MRTKKLLEKYNQVVVKTGNDRYYDQQYFLNECKKLLSMIDKGRGNKRVYVTIKASRSGMSRKFYFENWINRVLNIVNNGKYDLDVVQSYGCGMDMLWHELYRFYNVAVTSKYADKHGLNGKCSHCTYVLGE